ncbi:MAG: OB-fold nucleic acid binding domain-containing protein, partial [Actinomycetota bacterium]
EMLGLYLTDHPLRGYGTVLARLANCTTVDLESSPSEIVTLAGLVSKVERKVTKRGDHMAVIQLEDLHGGVELTVFSKTLQQHGHKLYDDAIVAAKVRVDSQDDRKSYRVIEVSPVVLSRHEPELRLNLPTLALDPENVARLKSILTEYPGRSQVYLHVGDSKVLRLGEEFRVDIDRVIPPLRVAFGAGVIR